ncbi:unnamed protein product [Mycena citricolor]|uniref:Major facilitator superfamily (MFS) profile domain-containing protein n=1 Tax=Mycena citricolor TaxID=2018698 RepID=A0AAD2HIZ5_9AGAR|nr:unnamed protein product [Mycena citricolor]
MPDAVSSSSSSAPESQRLLSKPPPSYHSVDDGPVSEQDSPPPLLNNFSKSDTVWILAGLWSAVFLGALGTVVATLLTPIGSDFNKSNQASYIGTSYLLSLCCFTPLYGRMSDILGRKGAMLTALFLFGTGTLLCGFCPSMKTLIMARTLAGMGGGGLYGLGAGIGGPLGGWVNDKFGWRSAFLFQAPLLIVSAVLVAWKVNIRLPSEVESQSLHEKLRRVDALGSATLVGTVGTLLLGFSLKTTEEIPWSHPSIVSLFSASAVCCVSFVLVEKYWAPFPVMPLGLITRRTPLAVSVANLFASMAAFSMIYNVPLYFSAVRLYSAANTGSHLLPHSVSTRPCLAELDILSRDFAQIAISFGSVFAGWAMRRTGKLYVLTLVASAASIFANILVILWDEKTSQWHLWLDIVPHGFGMASFITTTLIAITYLFRTTGQVLGVSLSGAILQAVLVQKLRERIQGPGSAELIHQIQHATDSIGHLDPVTRKAAVDSYADALRVVFIFQAAMSFLAFLSSIPIQESPLPELTKRTGMPGEAEKQMDVVGSKLGQIVTAVTDNFLSAVMSSAGGSYAVNAMRNARVMRDVKARKGVLANEVTRRAYLYVARNTTLPAQVRHQAQLQLNSFDKYSRPTTVKNRCAETGRGRGIIGEFALCRHQFRLQALHGQLNGVRKAMW